MRFVVSGIIRQLSDIVYPSPRWRVRRAWAVALRPFINRRRGVLLSACCLPVGLLLSVC